MLFRQAFRGRAAHPGGLGDASDAVGDAEGQRLHFDAQARNVDVGGPRGCEPKGAFRCVPRRTLVPRCDGGDGATSQRSRTNQQRTFIDGGGNWWCR